MKRISIIFLVVCMVLCILPFGGMSFAQTETTTENRKLKEAPVFFQKQGINYNILQDYGEYFNDHFAGRNSMVNIDSLVQSKVFQVSNADTVVKGTDGWLYYSDTLNDYLGKNLLSKRGIYNAARNISIMEQYVNSKGAKFVLAIAPNKNSLYDSNMPYYYSCKVSTEKNVKNLFSAIEQKNTSYVDFYKMFSSYDEILYLKRDSHWNNKGAMLAYNSIMDNLNLDHKDYSDVKVSREEKEIGDLNKMLYPLSPEPEWNYYYDYDYTYEYVTPTKSVEEPWIQTQNAQGNGNLLMFRDSFGNTLLPFFAQEFENAYFSKAIPYALDLYMDLYSPGYVVVEKVERNIDEFASDPPVMTGISNHRISVDTGKDENSGTLNVESYEGNTNYYRIYGAIDKDKLKDNSDIYVVVNGMVYDAFGITDNKGDNGYTLYLKKDWVSGEAHISVVYSAQGEDIVAKTKMVNFSSIK